MQILKGAKYKLKNCVPSNNGHIIQSTNGSDGFKWVTNNNPYIVGKYCIVGTDDNDNYLIPLLTIKEL